MPNHVEIYDCGTGGLDVLEPLEGADKAIIIDTVKSGRGPGESTKNIIVIGVEPKVIEPRLEPSPEVRKAIPQVIHAIFREIED